MAPRIDTVTPNAGHSGGRAIVDIYGVGFRLPDPPPASGPTTSPNSSVQVTFGGVVCPVVQVISEQLLRVLTPIHDPSGARSRPRPDADDLPASDVTVTNLDAQGQPIPGESATATSAYSFQRPLLDAVTPTKLAVDQLVIELQRQVLANTVLDPHTDYDDDTGDALNIVEFSHLPGIGLTSLRLPTSKAIGDREQVEVDVGQGMVAVRRQPIIRDAVLTCIGASDNATELQALELAVFHFARKNPVLYVPQLDVEYVLDYARGEGVTETNRSMNVATFQSEFRIRNIVETDMPGITGATNAGNGLGVHEATVEIAYKMRDGNVGVERNG